MYYSIFDFSDNLLSFAKKIVKKGLEENADSEALLLFYYSFCNKKVNLATNIKEITGAFKGYLYLNVTPVGEKKMSFPKIEHKGVLHYITSGVFILPHAASIIKENNCNGYLLDFLLI